MKSNEALPGTLPHTEHPLPCVTLKDASLNVPASSQGEEKDAKWQHLDWREAF